MMTVDSVSGANNNMQAGSAGKDIQIDPVSKSLQNQIADEQKKLMSLSSDEEETQEEKIKKRREIRQEISSLNQKLRQRQIEQKKQEKREQAAAVDNNRPEREEKADRKTDAKEDAKKEDERREEPQQSGMRGMVSAETFVKQAYVQGSVARQMAGRVEVLKAEIKQDSANGADTERKKKELEALEKKAQAAAEYQFSTVADANKTIKNVMEKDDKKTENKSGVQKIVIKENTEEQQAWGIMNQNPVRYVVSTS